MRRRSRTIGVLAGLASLFLLVLIARMPPGRVYGVAPRQDAPPRPVEATKGGSVEAADLPSMPGDPPAMEPPLGRVIENPNAPALAPIPAFAADPEKSAEDFLARTRKEATDAVEALNREAAQLRDRLAKVESGLSRYKATLDALNSGQVDASSKAGATRGAVEREADGQPAQSKERTPDPVSNPAPRPRRPSAQIRRADPAALPG